MVAVLHTVEPPIDRRCSRRRPRALAGTRSSGRRRGEIAPFLADERRRSARGCRLPCPECAAEPAKRGSGTVGVGANMANTKNVTVKPLLYRLGRRT